MTELGFMFAFFVPNWCYDNFKFLVPNWCYDNFKEAHISRTVENFVLFSQNC